MNSVLSGPRLKLTLITRAERGSQEFEWLHKLHSDQKATFWNLAGQSKSEDETTKALKRYFPNEDELESAPAYRMLYAVHEILDSKSDSTGEKETEFIGAVTLRSIECGALPLPDNLALPESKDPETLSVEVAYFFLPGAWGKGYGTESLQILFEACQNARTFWTPFSRLYVRALVNSLNALSQRVVTKCGMTHVGNYIWTGEAVFLRGEWIERDDIQIWGKILTLD